jgi:hypothetical protein
MRQASDDDGTKFLCSKAELIDELESSLPSFMRGEDWCDDCCALPLARLACKLSVFCLYLVVNCTRQTDRQPREHTDQSTCDGVD